MMFSPMSSPPGAAATAGSSVNASDIIAIAAAFLTLVAVIIALRALKYAKDSARYAKESAQYAADTIEPLQSIASDIRQSAELQLASLESARQLRRLELLSTEATTLQEIVSVLTTMAWIQNNADSLEAADKRFNQEQESLLIWLKIALKTLPGIRLPKCGIVATVGGYRDALPYLTAAGVEANQTLTHVLKEVEEISETPVQPSEPHSKTKRPKPNLRPLS
jgi:hypothetical protein